VKSLTVATFSIELAIEKELNLIRFWLHFSGCSSFHPSCNPLMVRPHVVTGCFLVRCSPGIDGVVSGMTSWFSAVENSLFQSFPGSLDGENPPNLGVLLSSVLCASRWKYLWNRFQQDHPVLPDRGRKAGTTSPIFGFVALGQFHWPAEITGLLRWPKTDPSLTLPRNFEDRLR
jgi:hypothetical protein